MTRELVLKKVDLPLPGHIAVRSITLCGSKGPDIYHCELSSSYHINLITKASYYIMILLWKEKDHLSFSMISLV